MIIFGFDTKSNSNKSKISKRDHIKLKSFHIAKEIINKMKRPPTKWVKIFINHIPDKGLVSKIYIEFIQLSRKKQTI